MDSTQLFNIVTIAYFSSMVLFVVYLATRSKAVATIANVLAYGGWLAHTAAIGWRWYDSYQIPGGVGHAPLTNLYESVVFFSWTILLIYILIDLKYQQRAVGAFVIPFAFPRHDLGPAQPQRRHRAIGAGAAEQLADLPRDHLLSSATRRSRWPAGCRSCT